MKTNLSPWLPVALLVVAALPFASDGVGECCNATTTLAAGITDPTNGDEAFFKSSSGAANTMLFIDNSGSMAWMPQCTYGSWDVTANRTKGLYGCQTPNVPAPTVNTAVATPVVTGTCLPSTGTAGLTVLDKNGAAIAPTPLAWMEAVVPQRVYADPGHGLECDPADGTTVIQDDRPAWGGTATGATWSTRACSSPPAATNCAGDNCLYDPDAYYFPGEVGAFTGDYAHQYIVTSLRRRAHDTDAALPKGCLLLDTNGNAVRDVNNNTVPLGADCASCMTNHGFYIFNVAYATNYNAFTKRFSFTNSGPRVYLKGTFLNANPQKAVTARRILKDVLWMNDDAKSNLDSTRMGLAWFAGNDLGTLPVTDPTDASKPLGLVPTKTASVSADPTAADAEQKLRTIYKKARKPIIGFINSNNDNFASTNTPLAHTLLSVGQYFADNTVWTGLAFGAAFNNATFSTLKTTEKCSICWDCARNSVVVITDGSPNETETGWPAKITGAGGADYTAACGTGGANCIDREALGLNNAAMLPRVAYWLHNTAIHPAGGLASSPNVYMIGVNLPAGDPLNILKAAGTLGGGGWSNAEDPAALAAAVFKAVQSASTVESSYSAPSVTAFQMSQTSTTQAFLSRFLPNASNTWEGHVFAGKIFDEFANGCDPTKAPADQPTVKCNGVDVSANFNGNTDGSTGLSICSDVFLVDQNCKAIQEGGSTGQFFELDFSTDHDAGTLSSTKAEFAWDGGYLLNYTLVGGVANPSYRTAFEPTTTDAWGNGTAGDGSSSWKARNIWTVVPDATGGWTRTAFTTGNLAALQPFLSIEPTWCTALLSDLGFTATSTPALPATAALQATACAKAIVYWVRGFDLFDADGNGCAAPGFPHGAVPTGVTCNGAQERNRENVDDGASPKKKFWKLGDTFHSAPVAVKAPIDQGLCNSALDNQCVATLYSPSWLSDAGKLTPLAQETVGSDSMDAYTAYWTKNLERKKVVLVGANDGMLHAFDAGLPDKTLPKYATGGWQYTDGTGEELWAFIPPDLLPKLWRLVKKGGLMSDHQYMVDGSTMVRDIWVDQNGDSKKQSNEFHTIAVLSERAGGTQYTALDLTDPTKPVVRWAFPQACSDDAKYMGQSWSDFAPRPPPIGPVKIKSTAGRGFDELWITMINGGYDPAMGLGRAVFMLDAWTGATVWRYTDDDFKADHGYGAGTSMFPVPGAVALTDLGDLSTSIRDQDGFFDTATWGDLGGNLFVARFREPGDRSGTAGRVVNWKAARTFEESRGDGNDKQLAGNRSEFFYMPANTYESQTKTLRTYLGSGNRERLKQIGAACGTDNLMACCQAGCTVTSTSADSFGTCDFKNVFSCDAAGALSRAATGFTGTACSTTTPATCGASGFTASSALSVSCPGAVAASAAGGSMAVSATGVATPASPAFGATGEKTFGTPSLFHAQPLSRFYGIWAYGGNTKKQFNDLASAKLFEANRFTDVKLASTACAGPAGGTCTLVNTTPAQVAYSAATQTTTVTCVPATAGGCQATEQDAGWFYEYAANERTGSGATVGLGCAAWTSLTPVAPTSTTADFCSTGQVGSASMSGFLSNYVTGVQSYSCGYTSGGAIARAAPRTTTAPPISPIFTTALSGTGKAQYSVRTINPGSTPDSQVLGSRDTLVETVYWLEVDKSLHDCRHGDRKNCD